MNVTGQTARVTNFKQNNVSLIWGDPTELKDSEPPLYPIDALPSILSNYVGSLSAAMQVPQDMVASLVLAAVSTAAQKRVDISGNSDWTEPANIFTMVALNPGERKSAAISAVMGPIKKFEQDKANELQSLASSQQAQKDAYESAAELLKSKYAKAPSQDNLSAYLDAKKEVAEFKVQAIPRLTTADVTQEKLADLLYTHGKMSLISAEGGIFNIMNGLYSKSTNIDIFLCGHANDTVIVDRVGRPPLIIDKAILTIGLAVQPQVLESAIKNKDFIGKGLMARFLFSVPAPMIGHRDVNPPILSPSVKSEYNNLIRNLLDDPSELHLSLSSQASVALTNYRRELEPTLRCNGTYDPYTAWGSKAPGAVLRIAALIHVSGKKTGTIVDAESIKNAIRIVEYYSAHAKRAFGGGESQLINLSKKVLSYIENKKMKEITTRDIMRAYANDFRTSEDTKPIIVKLISSGYLQESVSSIKKQGPKAMVYQVNPQCYEY
ncbi:YfjI family protein [Anoxynatronum buryatiense]|uniref:DUF3987 domain-containing protein n=1 Tax=Anoxynatronum buryatiense TaxID=489973 RepID=A0AA45WZ29_9CLOT|nr:YfjI family protein [Anoxynatronum buryatiense]SMP72033.1 Protein of unknown function [Anoxynatronum buryatiense]